MTVWICTGDIVVLGDMSVVRRKKTSLLFELINVEGVNS